MREARRENEELWNRLKRQRRALKNIRRNIREILKS
jgi:hypothetical protein